MNDFLLKISDIQFVSIDDFMDKKDYIKERFNELDLSTKQIYKYYFFYQLCLIKDGILKECCWSYLHDQKVYYKNQEVNLEERYKEFCSRRKKIYNQIEGQLSFIDIQD